jgi:hypothetical protein
VLGVSLARMSLQCRCSVALQELQFTKQQGNIPLAVDIDPINRKPGTRLRVSCAFGDAHASGLRLTDAAFGRNQMNPGIMNRRKQREQSAGAFSVVSVTSCSKCSQENKKSWNSSSRTPSPLASGQTRTRAGLTRSRRRRRESTSCPPHACACGFGLNEVGRVGNLDFLA